MFGGVLMPRGRSPETIGRYVAIGVLAGASGVACAASGSAWLSLIAALSGAAAASLVAREFHHASPPTDSSSTAPTPQKVAGASPADPVNAETYAVQEVGWIPLPGPGEPSHPLPVGWDRAPLATTYSTSESCGHCGATIEVRPERTCERCGSALDRQPSGVVSPVGDWAPYPPER
jgi:hypothetical protein